MNNISDEELRSKLVYFGEDVGPLSNSTRLYWRKRLEKLMQSTNNKQKATQDKGKRNHKPPVSSSTKRNRIKYTKKPVQIQQRDKSLLDNLRKFGVQVPRVPLNDAIRIQYQKKLASLMSGAENSYLERELALPEHESTNYLEDQNLIDNLEEFEIEVPRGPLTHEIRTQCQKKLDSLKSAASSGNRYFGNETITTQYKSSNYFQDLELINDLSEFGIHLPLEKLNDSSRPTWQKTLENLMDIDGSRIVHHSENNEYTPPYLSKRSKNSSRVVNMPVNHLKDNELIENLEAYGVLVPRGSFNDATRDHWKILLHKLRTGVLSKNGICEVLGDYGAVNSHESYYHTQVVPKPRRNMRGCIKSLTVFLIKGFVLFGIIFIIAFVFYVVGMTIAEEYV